MIDTKEAKQSVEGAARLLVGQAHGMDYFGRGIDAFWRSFSAILFSAPVFLTYIWLSYIMPATPEGAAPATQISAGIYLLLRSIHYLIDWLVYPVAFIFLARLLNVTGRYGTYITALNWTSVIINLAYLPAITLHALAAGPNVFAEILGLATLGVALRLRWFIAKLALGVSGWTAAGLVFVEFALSEILRGLVDRLL